MKKKPLDILLFSESKISVSITIRLQTSKCIIYIEFSKIC